MHTMAISWPRSWLLFFLNINLSTKCFRAVQFYLIPFLHLLKFFLTEHLMSSTLIMASGMTWPAVREAATEPVLCMVTLIVMGKLTGKRWINSIFNKYLATQGALAHANSQQC